MSDDGMRAWMADHPDAGIPSVVACPDCAEPLGARFGDSVLVDVEWTDGEPGRWTRPWSRTDAGRPARHAGYQKRTRREPVDLPSGGTLRDAAYSSAYPGIRELGPEDVLICKCGREVPLARA